MPKAFLRQMQMADTHNLPLRARYYQAMCDIDTLEAAADYSKLKESYVIFICPFDLFGERLPVYTFENLCLENHKIHMEDRTRKIFYNFSEYAKIEDKEARAIMEYFKSGTATDTFTNKIQDSLDQARGNESWRRENMMYRMLIQETKDEMQTVIDRQAAEIKTYAAENANYVARIAALEAKLAQYQQA